MLKIKLFAIAAFVSLAVFALNNSRYFVTSANEDAMQEIAKYKTWQRINKEPIKVDGKSDNQNVFIIDGQEVTNFRVGDLGG